MGATKLRTSSKCGLGKEKQQHPIFTNHACFRTCQLEMTILFHIFFFTKSINSNAPGIIQKGTIDGRLARLSHILRKNNFSKTKESQN